VIFHLVTRKAGRSGLRSLALLVMSLLTAAVVFIEIAAHELFKQTGLLLNWSMLLFGIERSEMLLRALESQLTTATIAYSFMGLAYMVFFVWWLFTRARNGDSESRPGGAWQVIVLVMLYCMLLYHSGSFGFTREEFRGFSSHLLLSYFESAGKDAEPLATGVKESLDLQAVPPDTSNAYRHNVAIIILESTRERSVAPYVANEVTPYFEDMAGRSLLMQHAYSTSPHTSRAIYSILCGRFPRAGTGIRETLENGISQPCLPHLLRQLDYATAFFQSATEDFENRPQLVENMGFENFFPLEELETTGFEKANYFGYEDDIMLPASHDWLAGQQGPLLATYLTVAPHFHYDAIGRYGWAEYASDKKYNAYLNTLHYQDNFLRNLVQQYKDLGLYEDTLFIILGDHGQGFREHHLWGHGNIIYEEGVKVPFLVHFNGELVGRVESRVSLLDVAPTVLGHLNLSEIDGVFSGQNLLQPLDERDILLECISPRQCSSLIDAETGLKLIHNYHRKPDELYDLTADPRETNNLAVSPSYLKTKQRLLSKLLAGIESISSTGQPVNYNSWAYNRKPIEWLDELPNVHSALNNSTTNARIKGNTGVLALESSKADIFPGDSFNLKIVLEDPDEGACIETFYEGIKRHRRRTHNLDSTAGSGYPYFQITENLQVLPSAANIKIDIYRKQDCSDGAPVISHNRVVIALPDGAAGGMVFSEKARQYFRQRPLPSSTEKLVSTNYLEDLLDPSLPVGEFSADSVAGLRSAEFVDGIRENLGRLQASYGEYLESELVGVWESNDGGVTSIYRYQVFFSANRAMDFRIFVRNSRAVALYYYHPWSADRPL
jgi:arylsulfatase A-like enzyme